MASDTASCYFAVTIVKYNLSYTHCGCMNSVPRSEKATKLSIDTMHTARLRRKHLLQESRNSNLRNIRVLIVLLPNYYKVWHPTSLSLPISEPAVPTQC